MVGLVLSAPLMLATAMAIRLESPGPIFYAQERGRARMRPHLHALQIPLDAGRCGAVATPIWARDGDDRVTRIGRFIRLTRLDELPQLWNVLRGDMSFVGPRPERPFFVEQLAEKIPYYRQRHAVKPGITGWAQVKYRYGASIEDAMEKLRYDLYYIKHMSIIFDMTIVLRHGEGDPLRQGRQVKSPVHDPCTWGPEDRQMLVQLAGRASRAPSVAA